MRFYKKLEEKKEYKIEKQNYANKSKSYIIEGYFDIRTNMKFSRKKDLNKKRKEYIKIN